MLAFMTTNALTIAGVPRRAADGHAAALAIDLQHAASRGCMNTDRLIGARASRVTFSASI